MALYDRSMPEFMELIQRRKQPAADLLLFTFLLLCSSLVDATFNFAPTMNFPFPMRTGTSSLTMSDPLLDPCCSILREITASQCLSVLSSSACILERNNIYYVLGHLLYNIIAYLCVQLAGCLHGAI